MFNIPWRTLARKPWELPRLESVPWMCALSASSMPHYPMRDVPVLLLPAWNPWTKGHSFCPSRGTFPLMRGQRACKTGQTGQMPAGRAVGNASSCLVIVDFGSKPVRWGALLFCCCLTDLLHWACQSSLCLLWLYPESDIPKSWGPWPAVPWLFLLHLSPLTCLCLASCYSGLFVHPEAAQCCQGPGYG